MKFIFVVLLLAVLCASALAADQKKPRYETPVIGIDLGTTYSCAGIYRQGKVEIIPTDGGQRTVPSIISYDKKGAELVGQAAKNNAHFNPRNTLYDVKRLIGRRYKEVLKKDAKLLTYKLVNNEGKVNLKIKRTEKAEPEILAPEQVSARVLTHIKKQAEKYLGEPVNYAVITVPAYFNDQQRTATQQAGKLAGLNVLRIINEPTAASMAYGLDSKKDEQYILVFDLGGGTFDVSLLAVDDNVFEVTATSGDTRLGGEDFDMRIVEHFAKVIMKKHKADIKKNAKAFQKLKQACEAAKRTLSTEVETRIEIENLFDGIDFSEKLTRAKFEQLNMDLFKRTMKPVAQVLKDSGMKKSEIDEIVLVGGSTRIPKIRELLKSFFSGKELHLDINPDEAVAYGATVQAAVLAQTMDSEVVLIDVTSLSLGIETLGGRMSVIIPRNTPIPATKTDSFTTTTDYQDRLVIPIYEGERKRTKYNRLLGEMELTGIQKAPKGVPQIEVTLKLDQNSILSVTAFDKHTKKQNEVTIQKGTLTDDEIKQMLQDAKENEAEDKEFEAREKQRQKLADFASYMNQKLGDKHIKNRMSSADRNLASKALKKALRFLKRADEETPAKDYVKAYRTLKESLKKIDVLFGSDGLIDEADIDFEDDDDTVGDEYSAFDMDEQPISDDDEPIDDDEISVEEEGKKDEL